MHVDPITRADLSLFHAEERNSAFHRLDFTRTDGGREELRQLFEEPLSHIPDIESRQQLIQSLLPILNNWPMQVTNGTLHAVEKWLEYPLDPVGENQISLSNLLYKWLHPADHSMMRYSLPHLVDLAQACNQVLGLLEGSGHTAPLLSDLRRLSQLLRNSPIKRLLSIDRKKTLPYLRSLELARLTRYVNRTEMLELLHVYYRLDAWYSVAKATQELKLTFPIFRKSTSPHLRIERLTHIQLEDPVGYNLSLNEQHRLLFLTGANMAGKSTLIRSVGIAVYLAHLGMGVPADYMELSLFDGLLSNVTITDNLARGESYFFNEVQRIKKTLEHMMDGRRWLVLIDELFKGTNVEDARRCSLEVIKGIVHLPNAITFLSTHLYEIGESLKAEPGILYRYFETEVRPDTLHFSYQLKEGISQDRIGYRILEREGVVSLLQQIPRNIDL